MTGFRIASLAGVLTAGGLFALHALFAGPPLRHPEYWTYEIMATVLTALLVFGAVAAAARRAGGWYVSLPLLAGVLLAVAYAEIVSWQYWSGFRIVLDTAANAPGLDVLVDQRHAEEIAARGQALLAADYAGEAAQRFLMLALLAVALMAALAFARAATDRLARMLAPEMAGLRRALALIAVVAGAAVVIWLAFVSAESLAWAWRLAGGPAYEVQTGFARTEMEAIYPLRAAMVMGFTEAGLAWRMAAVMLAVDVLLPALAIALIALLPWVARWIVWLPMLVVRRGQAKDGVS
jgi:hypothetical protein